MYCLAPTGHAIAHVLTPEPYDPTSVTLVGKPDDDVHDDIKHPYGPNVTERPGSLITGHVTVHLPDASRLYPVLHTFWQTLYPDELMSTADVSFASAGFVYEHVATVHPELYVYTVPASPGGHADIVATARVNAVDLKSNEPAMDI